MIWEKITHSGKSHAILFMDTVFQGYKADVIKNFFQIKFNPTHYRQFEGARWWLKNEVDDYLTALQKKEQEHPGFLLKKAQEYEKLNREFLQWSSPFRDRDFSKESNESLLETFSTFVQHLSVINALVYTCIFLDRFYTDEIVKIIASNETDFKKQKEHLNDIFQIPWGLQTHLKKEALLNITKKEPSSPKIEGYLRDFGHLNLLAFHGRPDTKEDFLIELKQINPEKTKEEINKIKNNSKKVSELCGQLNLSIEDILKINTLRAWAFIANNDDHYVFGSIANLWNLWHEIARRLGMSFKEFIEMTITEITQALKQNSISEEIKNDLVERGKASAMIWENNDVLILTGKELEAYASSEKNIEKELFKVKELKGMPASPGTAVGSVQILTDIRDLHKVKEGNILVAIYTYPAIVVAMQKAAAIVTDRGGLLSHAAIVSRELGKPCIVGIEIGTKVFKNGDIVEVDANKGIVRKIK